MENKEEHMNMKNMSAKNMENNESNMSHMDHDMTETDHSQWDRHDDARWLNDAYGEFES